MNSTVNIKTQQEKGCELTAINTHLNSVRKKRILQMWTTGTVSTFTKSSNYMKVSSRLQKYAKAQL